MEDMQLVVESYSELPIPAGTVSLRETNGHVVDAKMWPDLKLVIGKEYNNRIVTSGSVVSLEFFNKTLTFEVTAVVPYDFTEQFGDLELKLEQLKIDDGAAKNVDQFLISRRTEFELKLATDDAAEVVPIVNKMQLIGGLDRTISELREYMKLAFGQTKSMAGMQISRSVLLYGLPGCGKSLLCAALAQESGAAVITVNASEIFSKFFGETEANLLGYFDRVYKNYPKPTILIIEELLSVCAKEPKEDSAKRVQSAFLNALDSIHSRLEGSRCFVLTTTSNIELLNPAARRSGRIDIEIEISVPNPIGREAILRRHLSAIANDLTAENVLWLAHNTHGFVGADLASLISKAAVHSINEAAAAAAAVEPKLSMANVNAVFATVKPSAMREVLIECPNVKWSDIGGQDELKLQLKQAIEWPLTHPERFQRLGIQPPRGILMFGPPGCSKTMIAKALATESKVNFLSIKGPELFSMWVGESERAVRDLFRKARQVAPAIIFFDEIDAIGGERSSGGAASSVKERVLAQMLTEMDGVNALQNVTIVAATNRPDLIDKALMRPGRIDRIVYVRLPDAATRREIFRIAFVRMPIADDVDVADLVDCTEGYSGAEVQAVCQEAALKALEDDFDCASVARKDFAKALHTVQPRTGAELLKLYEDYVTKS